MIYAITAEKGPIKIGFSLTPTKRLRALQTASPYRLAILACIHGDEEDEDMAHRYLANARLLGEHFRRIKKVRDFVEGMTIGLTVRRIIDHLDEVDAWRRDIRTRAHIRALKQCHAAGPSP